MISTLPKKIKIVRWFLILMGTFGVFLSLFQALVLYDAWRSYEDPFPTVITLPLSIGLTFLYFLLAEKLYQGRIWAWYASFWTFVLFTTGDIFFSLWKDLGFGLLGVMLFHSLGALLLYLDKEKYMSFASSS